MEGQRRLFIRRQPDIRKIHGEKIALNKNNMILIHLSHCLCHFFKEGIQHALLFRHKKRLIEQIVA